MFNHPIGSNKPPQRKPMAKAPIAQAEPDGDEAGQMGNMEDGAQIAQEHGPAHEVHISHQHEAGMHHVTSEHPDGHHHESDHGSAEEAHEHGKKLATGGEQESDGWDDEPKA